MEIANLNGFSHAGAPVITRGSTNMPTSEAPAPTSISIPTAVSGGLVLQRLSTIVAARFVG